MLQKLEQTKVVVPGTVEETSGNKFLHMVSWDVSDSRDDLLKDGEEAIRQAKRSSWWKWDGGSCIVFWRWPASYRRDALYGARAQLDEEPRVFGRHNLR